MIYEFIATITAGFGMAGIALIVRHLSKLVGKQAPKWLIPIFAGIGMLGFQIHQEYHWHEQQMNLLPADVKVIKVIEGTSWFRPWSYVKPQVIRFMAVDSGQPVDLAISQERYAATDSIKRINIYLYERRISTKIIPQLINCRNPAIAVIQTNTLDNSAEDNTHTTANHQLPQWHKLPSDDPLLQAVCQD